jgi:hypothetical protein
MNKLKLTEGPMRFSKFCFFLSILAFALPSFSESKEFKSKLSKDFIAGEKKSVFESCSGAVKKFRSFLVFSEADELQNQYCHCVSQRTVEGELRDPETNQNRDESQARARLDVFRTILDNWGSYESQEGPKTFFDMQKLSTAKEKVLLENQLIRMEACVSSK